MRHLLILAAVFVVIGALYFMVQGGTVSVNGRVLLQDVDGREQPGSGARVAWHTAAVVDEHLRAWFEAREDWQRKNELEIRAVRNEWTQKVAARDEAARILRVAERANSADLEICRARHREAAADAEEALRKMEKLGSGADAATDPARFLAGLPSPSAEFAAGADGQFSVQATRGDAGYVVASLERGAGRQELLVWLQRAEPGQSEQVQLSNANLLTGESLARLAREIKNRGATVGSPANSSAD